jgi:hypothetical protein
MFITSSNADHLTIKSATQDALADETGDVCVFYRDRYNVCSFSGDVPTFCLLGIGTADPSSIVSTDGWGAGSSSRIGEWTDPRWES